MTESLNNSEDEIMCDCTGTARGAIKRMFNDGLDFDAISSKTGVNTGCGGCEWDIQDYLETLKLSDQ